MGRPTAYEYAVMDRHVAEAEYHGMHPHARRNATVFHRAFWQVTMIWFGC